MSRLLRGRAIAFGKTVPFDGGFELVARHAFNGFLARPTNNVTLVFGSHDEDAPVLASTFDRSLQIFADEHGLSFSAEVADAPAWPSWQAYNQASVLMRIEASAGDRYAGRSRNRITQASLEHIAIVSAGSGMWDPGAIYGNYTAAWCAGAYFPNIDFGTVGSRRLNYFARVERFDREFQDAISASSTREFAYAKVGR